MRLPVLRWTAAVALLVLPPLAALGADEPEAVYAKFHRAAMAGDLVEMLTYGPAQRRAEILGMSESGKEAALKMAQYMMPRAFTVQSKSVRPNGRATLIVSGPWEGGQTKLAPIYGTVQMLMENGAWKVDEVSWNTEKPPILAAPKPAAPPAAADKAAAKGAPVAGSMNFATPGRTLGEARPPCVYKPVMTAQDIENCK